MNNMPSDPVPSQNDELLAEYRFDYKKAKPNRFAAHDDKQKAMVVVLDEDVAQVFKTPESVNKVLRALIQSMPQPVSNDKP